MLAGRSPSLDSLVGVQLPKQRAAYANRLGYVNYLLSEIPVCIGKVAISSHKPRLQRVKRGRAAEPDTSAGTFFAVARGMVTAAASLLVAVARLVTRIVWEDQRQQPDQNGSPPTRG